MPNEQDGKVKFGRSYVYLDPDSLASTPDAATPGVWRVKSGVDNSGDPSIGVVNAVNTRTGNVTLTSADVGLANVNNTSDANKPVSTAQQTALNAKIDTTTANNTLLGITAKAADSELLDGLNSTSFVQTNTQFGGDVSGAYNSIVIADDSHNHVISNVDGLQSALDIKADLVGGVVPTNQLPAIAITEYLGSVSSQSALLALSGQKGDWAIRSDTSTTWIITGTTPSNIGSWTELQYPAAPVSSVNGATGTVVLGHSDVGAASTAQGTTADSAIQPGDNISQLTNNSGFISATLTDEEVQDIVGGMVSGNTESGITVTYQDTDGTIDFDVATQSDNNFTTVLKDKLDAIEVSATADQTASEIITSLLTVDGANSGLDSDLLDGQHGPYYLDYTNFTNTPTFENANKLDNLDSTQFLRSDAADVKTSGTLNFGDDVKLTLGTSDDLEIYHDGTNSYIDDTGTGNLIIGSANLQLTNVAHTENYITATDNGSVDLYYDAVKKFETTNTGATVTGTLTATAFSGAGGNVTGVNASQLNSQNAAYYLDYSNFSNTPTIPTNNNQLTNGAGYLTSPDGGDAITLDGLDSTDFLRSNADDTFTGELTVSGNLLLSDQVRIGDDAWIEDFDGANAIRVKGNTDSTQGYIAFGNRTEKLGCNNSATLSYDGNTIWNAGNDGSGSGLDADTVDGLDPNVSAAASSIAVRDSSSDISLRTIKSTFADETTISGAVGYRINNSTDNSLRFCSDMSAVRAHIGANNASNLTTGTIPVARISGGAGTGLDADLLDGVQGSNYLRSDQNDTLSGNLTVNRLFLGGSSNGGFDYNTTQNTLEILTTNGSKHSEFNANAFIPGSHNTKNLGSNAKRWATLHSQDVQIDGNTAWHAGNDGAASGLDADLLDGQHGSYYLNYNNLTNLPAGSSNTSIGTGNSKAEIIDTGTDGRFIVTTEGSERLRITSTGQLSHIGGGSTGSPAVGFNGSAPSNSLVVNSSGAVGIGTTSPARLLDVNGSADFAVPNGEGLRLGYRGQTKIAYIGIDANDAYSVNQSWANSCWIGFDSQASDKNILYRTNSNHIFYGVNGVERLRIASSGVVTIGGNTAWHAGNDGSGSGLDADTIDGLGSGEFLRSNATDTASGAITFTSFSLKLSGHWYSGFYSGTQNYIHLYPQGHSGGASSTDIRAYNGTNFDVFKITGGSSTGLKWRGNTIWTAENDGSGSGLDADTVDGIQASSFLRSDAADTATGTLTIAGSVAEKIVLTGTSQPYIRWQEGTVNKGWVGWQGGASRLVNQATNRVLSVGSNLEYYDGTSYTNVWHSSNDGSGSGLDADLLDGQHGSYYTGYTDTAIANLIDSSPSTLDTLNELAAALGDDANFSATVTNSIATKLPLAGGQMTGNITFSGSQTVDGRDVSSDGSKLDGIESGATADQTAAEILTAIKTVDGSGSGLDADTLDGINSGSFLRSDANDTSSGQITLQRNSTSTTDFSLHIRNQQSAPAQIKFSNNLTNQAGYFYYRHEDANSNSAGNSFHFNSDQTSTAIIIDQTSGNSGFYVGTNKVWHAGNDGASSGLDADLVDGQQGSYYLNYNNFSNTPTIPTNNNQLTNGAGYVTSNTQLSTEQVQDIAGAMVSGNTESGITVTYQDSDGTIDFSVASQTDQNFTNADHTKLNGIAAGAQVNTVTSVNGMTGAVTVATFSGDYDDLTNKPAADIPQNSKTAAYTLVIGDNGKHINITTGGVTIPSGVFSAGNVVSIYNDSSSDQTITQAASVTLRLAGAATTGNRTLAQYGLVTVLCVASDEFVISGAGLT